MKEELAFRPDVVIVAIGENVPPLDTDEAKTEYRDAFVRLLNTLNENSHPVIFVRSCFWANPEKDELMKQAAAQAGTTYVDVGALGRDPANAARSERTIEHAGVAGHPGDKGMQALAERALFAESSPEQRAKNRRQHDSHAMRPGTNRAREPAARCERNSSRIGR